MRILHVTTRHISGGAAKNVRYSVEWELEHGHSVHVAAGPSSDWAQLPGSAEKHLIPDLVRAVRPVADLRAARHLAALMLRYRFDVVHTHLSKAGVLGRLVARKRVPVIAHTIHMASFGQGYSPAASLAFRGVERRCARFTDFFVSVGDELQRDYLAAGIGSPGQYSVIRSPLEAGAFAAMRGLADEERISVRSRYMVPPDVGIIAVAGMLEPRKRHDLVIERLAPLLRTGNTWLLVAGEGFEERRLQALVRRLHLGRAVRFLGHIDTMPELFAIADVFVHAATTEGVPQVIIQALAAGIPIVATETQGLAEIPGAPIRTVPGDGAGLCGAVAQTLRGARPGAVKLEAFAPWSRDEVSAALLQFHERLEQRLRLSSDAARQTEDRRTLASLRGK